MNDWKLRKKVCRSPFALSTTTPATTITADINNTQPRARAACLC